MGLDLTLEQKQILSGKMLQSVQILQMASVELDEYVTEAALENPTMDLTWPGGESIEQRELSYREREQTSYLTQRQLGDDDDFRDTWNVKYEEGESLRDHLWSQIRHDRYSPLENQILDYLIENLDEKGYLAIDLPEVEKHFHVPEQTILSCLEILQELEPAGICARDLKECLKLQLKREGLLTDTLSAIIDDNLDLVAKNKMAALSRLYGLTSSQAAKLCQQIRSLSPKPGSQFGIVRQTHYIVPDVYVEEGPAGFSLSLNEAFSVSIAVNPAYLQLSERTTDPEVSSYLQEKIRQTKWVQQCISQRGSTLLAVAREIVKKQEAFFSHGPGNLAPLRLSDIAASLDIHESTVSRAVTNKYLACFWGTFPLSYFLQKNAAAPKGQSFQSTQAHEADKGFTSAQVKEALQDIIQTENPAKPYSDRILSEKLEERGFPISRRTVAKYRDEAGIPDASARKAMGASK